MWAADHAAPATSTSGAVRALTAEERVGDGLAGLTEEHANARAPVRVGNTEPLAQLFEQDASPVVAVVVHHPEHPLCLREMRRQCRLPVLKLAPLGVLEEFTRWDVQRIRVAEAAAANATA